MRIDKIDWNLLRQQALQHRSWKKKSRIDWDGKAAGFAARNLDSPFIHRLLDLLQAQPEWSVLDVGSGPGTLALPLARQVKRVTALDFSEGMLAELRKEADRRGTDNIDVRLLSWSDDWRKAGIRRHDVTIGCRSLSVYDLESALGKLNDWADKKVFVVDRVGSGPFDPELFKAVGRKFEPGPDYIFTYNILYRMGIQARVDFIEYDQVKTFKGYQEAVDSCRWMLEPVSEEEEKKVHDYVKARLERAGDGSLRLQRNQAVKWACLSWDKEKQVPHGWARST